MKSERETNHKRLLIIGNELRIAGGNVGGGWDNWVMDIEAHDVMSTGCCTPLMNH